MKFRPRSITTPSYNSRVFPFLLGLVLAAASCGDDNPGEVDAADVDAAAVVDGAVPVIDAALPDAPLPDAPPPDAPPPDSLPPDAGAFDINVICTDVCTALDTYCGIGDIPMCVSECSVDLVDCSNPELQAIETCGTFTDCNQIITCIQAVACVQG